MNDKDKEAFEYWKLNFTEEKISILSKMSWEKIIKSVMSEAWQAACIFKQKEIDELLKQLKHEHDLYKKHLKVYEDENTKLRLVVDHYANMRGFGAYAKIMLRELEGK